MTYSYTNFRGLTSPLAGKPSVDSTKEAAVQSDIQKYVDMMNKKKTLVVNFQRANENGDLDTFVNGIHIVLPNSEAVKGIDETGPQRYDSKKRLTYLLYQYSVEIVSVDVEKKEVTVSWQNVKEREKNKVAGILRFMVGELQPERKAVESVVKDEVMRLSREDLREVIEKMKPATRNSFLRKLSSELTYKEMEERNIEKIIVPAQVVSVEKQRVILNLLGFDIPGYVTAAEYSYGFIDDMNNAVKKDDIIDVCVLAFASYKKNPQLKVATQGEGMYVCSRLAIIDNPWENLIYQKGDLVRITCSHLKNHNWFGFIDGLDLEIYCELPEKDKDCRIIIGQEYECYIYKVDAKARLLKARTIRQVRPHMTK